MRVLLVCHGYPPHGIAGVERLSEQTATTLARRGHEVTVLTRRPTAAPPTLTLDRHERDGVEVISIVGGGATYDRFPGHERELERCFQRVLAERPPDVVLVTHLLHHSPGYVDYAHRWGVPVVLELHDFFSACPRAHLERHSGERCAGPAGGIACAEHCFPDDGPERAVARWSLRAEAFARALRRADAVICPSRFVATYFAPMRGTASPIVVIENGVPATFARCDRPPARAPGAPLELASIGVATPHKGFHVVIDAVRRAGLPRARYTIFGATTRGYDAELREAAAAVDGLELRFFGRFEPAMLPALLADVDVVIVPSLVEETYSIAAREALACGVPVLASRIGALATAIREGVDGHLFAPGDATELAVLLQRLHARRDDLKALASGIRRDAIVTVDERTARLEQLLHDVVARGTPPPEDGNSSLDVLRDALAMALR